MSYLYFTIFLFITYEAKFIVQTHDLEIQIPEGDKVITIKIQENRKHRKPSATIRNNEIKNQIADKKQIPISMSKRPLDVEIKRDLNKRVLHHEIKRNDYMGFPIKLENNEKESTENDNDENTYVKIRRNY